MSSIITNRSALQALQAVDAAGRDLAATQNRISTGLKIATAKDDGAVYAIAQGMRGELSAWDAVSQSQARAASALDVTSAAVGGINDLLAEMKALAVAYADPSLDDEDRQSLRADIEAHIRQIDSQSKAASFDGLNFLSGVGVQATVYSSARYALPSSPQTPLSFLTPMSSGANTSVRREMVTHTGYSMPRSSLTPDSFAGITGLRQVAGGTIIATDRAVFSSPANVSIDRSNDLSWPEYNAAGRVDIWLDAFVTANAFEIWHGGQRVAASGQAYVPGGGPTGPGAAVTGQAMLSFDYDPANGQGYEIRASGGGQWAFEAGAERGPGLSAAPAPVSHPIGVTSRSTWTTNPAIDLRPETSGSSPAAAGVATVAADGGAIAGRVDLLFDGFSTPDVVEIYQNGVRVAATAQVYTPGGGPVAAGVPVNGQQVLSFDYDPANGHNLEFRFNENNAHAGAGWVVGGLELYPAGSPATSTGLPLTTTQTVTTSTYREAFDSLGADPTLLTPETEATGAASRTYTVDGGARSGRVDLWVDAYQDADVVEVWQAGVRIAATGQPYAPGGNGVSAGAAASGDQFLSFDYDPSRGQQLEFRFNPATPGQDGAWTVGGLVLQDPGAPLPSGLSPTFSREQGDVYPDMKFVQSTGGDQMLISSRNLTAAGLRLNSVDWADPADLLARIDLALERAISAASYFGSQQTRVELAMQFTSKLQDVLDAGVGNLVDADLSKEAALLQAQQIRQQLSVQTLSIAAAEPQWILSLFGR